MTREIAAEALRLNHRRSNREIGQEIGVDQRVVGQVRASLERSGEIEVFRARSGPRHTLEIRDDDGPLRRELLSEASRTGLSLDELSLSKDRDPFRLDTPRNRQIGEWLGEQLDAFVPSRRIHLRGLHYVLVTKQVVKPNGQVYRNTEADWLWMSDEAASAARWLGFVEFGRIIDARNDAPTIRWRYKASPEALLVPGDELGGIEELETPWIWSHGLDAIKSPKDLYVKLELPEVTVNGFVSEQRYRLVFVGEKSSLEPILTPIADRVGADVYLPAGEMTDTMVWQLAASAAEDGRRAVVFYLSDCDPSGWTMPTTLARKLQAMRRLGLPDLDIEVRRVALTPAQVREYGLPDTPLKATERRAANWVAAMGVEQTEVDALAALQPDLLRQLVEESVAPFYDAGLARRTAEAEADWITEAERVLRAAANGDARLRELVSAANGRRDLLAESLEKLAARGREFDDEVTELHRRVSGELRPIVVNINAKLNEGLDGIDDRLATVVEETELPEFDLPEAREAHADEPLFDSAWDYVKVTQRLKSERRFESEDT